MSRGERIRWDTRLSKPLADGGATICEKHDFALANYEDPSMTWEVCQALTQAKDDGERMERRIQDLGEEANNLEEFLDDAEKEIIRLKIAHLRRMEESLLPKMIAIEQSWRAEMARRSKGLPYQLPSVLRRKYLRMGRLADAIEDKITELKELQCSTKP